MKQRGLSFIELLVSLALSVLLITALTTHYFGLKRQFLNRDARIHQELDLFVLQDYIRASLRKAGFTPCASIDSLMTPKEQELNAVHWEEKKRLTIQSLSSQYLIHPELLAFKDKIHLKETHAFEQGMHILIADCFHAERLTIKAVAGKTLYFKTPLIYSYRPPIYLGRWFTESFYIAKNKAGIKALFYQSEKSEELSTTISDMQYARKHAGVTLHFLLDNGEKIIEQIRLRNA